MSKPRNKGKAAEPTAEELQFIYSKILGKLSDSEILEEMEGEPFERRTAAFIKRRRKELAAATKALGECQETGQKPLVVEALSKHGDDLLAVLEDWRDRFALPPAMFCPHPLAELARPVGFEGDEKADETLRESAYWDTRRDDWKEDLLKGKWQLKSVLTGSYITVPGWSPRAVIPFISGIHKKPPSYPTEGTLYQCLREHISKTSMGTLWEEWESSAERYSWFCCRLHIDVMEQARRSMTYILNRVPAAEEVDVVSAWGLADAVYEELLWFDRSEDAIVETYGQVPSPPFEYQSVSSCDLEDAGPTTVLRYGKAKILALSAKKGRQLPGWQVPEDFIEAIKGLHQDLLSKNRTSSDLERIMRLQKELRELQKSLENEVDLLLTKRIVPGKCRACPHA